MAVWVLPNVAGIDLLSMSQQQVQSLCSHVELLALEMLANNMRPDSKETVMQCAIGTARS